MTFKHKLSARLARLKDLVVLAALAATACERPVALTSPGGDPVTQLVVLPKALTVHPTQTAQLMAVAFTSAGDTGSVRVSWSVTGGSIIDTNTSGGRHYGRFRAGPDTGRIFVVALVDQPAPAPAWAGGVASASVAPLADTAVVSVIPVPVASVTVTPAVVGVLVGASVQLAAVTKDSAGNALSGRVVSWSSSAPAVAAVNGNGLVTGGAAGSATITATSEGRSGTSTITVTSVPTPVASVDVNPGSVSLQVGQTVQLTATPRDANGNALGGRAVSWASTNAAVATVNPAGLVTGAALGSATITATSEGKNGTSAITVTSTPTPVASVDVTPGSVNIPVGQTAQLTATPRDANGNALVGRAVTWSSSSTAVATVSSSGLVTGVAAGSATITATSEGRSGTSAITVTSAPAPVASVDVTPATASVVPGATVALTATLRDAAGNVLVGRVVTWSSSAPAIASVNGNGVVTGVTTGTATITATSEGRSGAAVVTVIPEPVAWVEVTPATATIVVGGTVQLTAVAKDIDGFILTGRPMSWSSSSVQIATVAAGLVTGVAAGTALIVATSEGKSDTATVTVTVVPVASVTVTPSAATLDLGETVLLTATPRDAGGNALPGRVVTWASSNAGVATVSASGLVTARAAGSATITATSEGQSGSAAVTVTLAPVASVEVSPASASLNVGWTIQLAAIVKDAGGKVLNGRTVTWSSSNPAVAAVSGTGVVTGVAEGSAVITATSEGRSGTGLVTVNPPPPAGAGIWISRDEIMRLPTSGSAWTALKSAADNIGAAVGGHTSDHDVHTLAAALVAVRLNSVTYYERAAANLILAIGTEYDGNSLSISRNLASYVIAADVLDFKQYDPTRELQFRAWVQRLLTWDHPAGGGCGGGRCSITDKHEDRPNNHGSMAGASRVAASLYLGDMADVARAATVFRGYLGDRSAYASFNYGELSWQCNPAAPVGVNPKGCVKSGMSIDGVQPDDQRRCGSFSNPPCVTGYAWEALQGIIVQAHLLQRAGYDVFNWSDQAILRAYQWLLTGPGRSPVSGDDRYQMPLLDRAYRTQFWNGSTVGSGKNMGWTDWTHQ